MGGVRLMRGVQLMWAPDARGKQATNELIRTFARRVVGLAGVSRAQAELILENVGQICPCGGADPMWKMV